MPARSALPAPAPEWVGDFCKDYSQFLFGVGKWTLIAGILLGIALALAMLVVLLRKKDGATDAVRTANASTPVAVLEAIRGFLQALSSAPTWLALFGGGILLLWLAGDWVPEVCKPPPPCPQQCPPAARPQGTTPSAATLPPGNNL